MQLTLSVLLSAVSTLISIGVTAIAWQYRDTEGVPELLAFNLGVVIWTAGNTVQHLVVTEGAKIFSVNVQYVGIALVPLGIWAFVAQFTGRTHWARGLRLGVVAAPLAALVVLSWTNNFHHLLRTENVQLVEQSGIIVDSFVELDRTDAWGPAFWLGWAYSQGLLIFSTGMLLWRVLYARDIYQYQASALVVGALIPWAGHFFYLIGISPFEAEVFFAFAGAAFVYAVLRYQLLDIVPIARDTVFQMMDDGVIVIDPDGNIVDVNDSTLDIADLDQSEVVGKSAETAFDDLPKLQEAYEQQENKENIEVRRDGELRHYDVRLSEFTFEGAWDESGVVLVLHDITPIRDRERELEQQNEQLEMVADTISHDLRNPLNVASGYLLQARETGNEDAFERIDRAHDRMEDIIEDVLTLARQDSDVEKEPVSLPETAKEAWDHVDTAGATLDIEVTGRVAADRGQLLTLFENLFRNAIEHGGEDIGVRVGHDDDGFYVEDDGPGIPPQKRDDVFDHGYTTNEQGTGFGLSIVGRVADAHGWTVEATAGRDGGARFEIAGVHTLAEATA